MITRSILQVGAIGVINTDEKLKAPIADLKSTLDTAMDSMRKSVHDLYDESVDLRQALAKLKPTDSTFAFSLEYDCEDDVPRDAKYALLSIAKEAVNNAVKHSNGDKIRIIVREHPAFYQLEIMDNGTSADERRISGRNRRWNRHKKYKRACCSDRRNHAYKGRRWFYDICDAHEEVRIYIKIKA